MLGVNLAVIGVVGCTMHLWSMRGIMTKNHRLAAQQEHLLAKQERLNRSAGGGEGGHGAGAHCHDTSNQGVRPDSSY